MRILSSLGWFVIVLLIAAFAATVVPWMMGIDSFEFKAIVFLFIIGVALVELVRQIYWIRKQKKPPN